MGFTYDYVKEYIESKGCRLISSEYIKSSDYIDIVCRDCGETFRTTFDRFKNQEKYICNNCSKKKQSQIYALDYTYVKYFIEEESNSGCKLLNKEYVNVDSKLLFQCQCGNEFETSFYKFKERNKRQCNDCGKKISSNKRVHEYDKIKNDIQNNSKCKLISKEYTHNTHLLDIQCKCGIIFQSSYSSFMNLDYKMCHECRKNIISPKRAFGFGEVKKYVEFESGSQCKLLSNEYINMHEPLLFLCSCGNKFETSFNVFKYSQKYQCNECGAKIRSIKKTKTQEEFEKKVYDLVGYEYTVVGKYTYSKDKIRMRHNKCSYEWNIKAGQFINNGDRCPKCTQSKIEIVVEKYFISRDISYLPQFKFEDCKDKRPLRFDFAIFDKYDNLIFLLETDGKQHFKEVYFGGINKEKASTNLSYTNKHDKIKNDYCKINNINLERIPYWEFKDIYVPLENILKKYKVI